MKESESVTNENRNQEQADNNAFSEVNEDNHERNQVASAQKQMASQETTGLLTQE